MSPSSLVSVCPFLALGFTQVAVPPLNSRASRFPAQIVVEVDAPWLRVLSTRGRGSCAVLLKCYV